MKKIYIVLLCILLCKSYQIHTMETLPNEVIRMLFESMPYHQRMSVSRVSKMWRYLITTFPVPQLTEEFRKNSFYFHIIASLEVLAGTNKDDLHVDIFDESYCDTFVRNDIDTEARQQQGKITKMRLVLWKYFPLSSLEEKLKKIGQRMVAIKQPAVYITDDFVSTINQYPHVTNLWINSPDQNAIDNLKHSNTFEFITLDYQRPGNSTDLLQGIKSLEALSVNFPLKRVTLLFSQLSPHKSDGNVDYINNFMQQNKTILELKIGVEKVTPEGESAMSVVATKMIKALISTSSPMKLHLQSNMVDTFFFEKYKENRRLVLFEQSSVTWE